MNLLRSFAPIVLLAGLALNFTVADVDRTKSLIAEIRKGEQEGDDMHASTALKFGRVQGVQGIIHARIDGVFVGSSPSPGGIRMADDQQVLQVRILLQAFEAETGRL